MLTLGDISTQTIGNIGLIYSAVADIAFVLIYALLAKWHQSPYGRLLMFKGVCFGAVLMLGAVRLVLDGTGWFDTIRVIIFLGVPITMTWQLWLLLDVQWFTPRRKAREDAEADTIPVLAPENKNI